MCPLCSRDGLRKETASEGGFDGGGLVVNGSGGVGVAIGDVIGGDSVGGDAIDGDEGGGGGDGAGDEGA